MNVIPFAKKGGRAFAGSIIEGFLQGQGISRAYGMLCRPRKSGEGKASVRRARGRRTNVRNILATANFVLSWGAQASVCRIGIAVTSNGSVNVKKAFILI